MDRIPSATTAVVSPKTTPTASDTSAPPPKVTDGQVTATTGTGPFAGGPPTAGASDIPEPPAGPPDSPFGEDALNKAFDTLDKLEKELDGIDPSTPEGSKKMMKLQRQINRIDETIRMINEMRRARHETNMSIIDNIA